MERIGK